MASTDFDIPTGFFIRQFGILQAFSQSIKKIIKGKMQNLTLF